ncbi:MAG TPA: Rrf2 family transcriptional regulator [Anaeromyxobacteraceae bacterium]|nr:Rrf2 family transcriptional regulator [Anaeromyxobacteraceae bacterium]
MKPSRKADYALRAMLDMALHARPGRLARTSEIARRTGAPVKFLETILAELRRARLLESRRGVEGGHRLARPPTRLSAGEIWRAIDGPLSQAERGGRRRGADGPARALSALWAEVEGAVARTVDQVTLDDLARRANEAAGVHDFTI